MINLIQPITVHQAYDGITHAGRWASWNWWWRMADDDDDDDFTSPEPKTDSRSALPRKNRRWRRLRIVKRDESFSLIFFSPNVNIWSWSWGRWRSAGPTRPEGAPSTLVARVWLPLGWFFLQYFLFFQKLSPWSFRSFRELLFLHKNNTMAILLRTTPVRVSSIQIMQIRVQNKSKSIRKSR